RMQHMRVKVGEPVTWTVSRLVQPLRDDLAHCHRRAFEGVGHVLLRWSSPVLPREHGDIQSAVVELTWRDRWPDVGTTRVARAAEASISVGYGLRQPRPSRRVAC